MNALEIFRIDRWDVNRRDRVRIERIDLWDPSQAHDASFIRHIALAPDLRHIALLNDDVAR